VAEGQLAVVPNGLEAARDPAYLRALYDGDPAVTIGAVKRRFIGKAVTGNSGAALGYDESARNILVENELKPLIDERVEAVPTDFSFEALEDGDDPEPDALADPSADPAAPAPAAPAPAEPPPSPGEALAAEVEAWARGPVTPDGLDLYTLFLQFVEDQEIDGAVAVVMGRYGEGHPRAGEAWVVARDATGATPEYGDPERPLEITAWQFEWWEACAVSADAADGTTRRKLEERIDATTRTLWVNGVEAENETHALGFIPVAVAPRRLVRGSPLGDSGVAELEQAYLNFLWADHMRNAANKYTAFRVWAPGDEAAAMAIQGDEDGGGMSNIQVGPSAVLKLNLEPRGGDVDLTSIENQRRESLETLRRLGRGESDQTERADMRSGKAAVVGRRGLQRYAARKLVFLKLLLQRIATIRARLVEEVGPNEEIPVCVHFADAEDADPTEQRERGKFWLEAFKAGAASARIVYAEWQRLGLVDEDADVAAMAAEVEAQGAEEAAASMERAMAIGVAGPPTEPRQPPMGE